MSFNRNCVRDVATACVLLVPALGWAGGAQALPASASLRAEKQEGGFLILEGDKPVFFYQRATKSLNTRPCKD